MKKVFAFILFFLPVIVHAQTVTVGATNTVMTFAQRNAIGQFWPDGNMGAVVHSGTNYLYAPFGNAHGMFGNRIPDLNNFNSGVSLVPNTTNIGLGATGDFDSTYASGGTIYFDSSTGILIGLYHGEHSFGGGIYYSGHGLAYSTDFGQNWHKLGPVVLPNASYATECGVEVGTGTLVSDGTFLYDYYSDVTQSDCPTSFASSVTVARASIASVIAAAQAGTPFTSGAGNLFMKYTGSGTWNGLGVTNWASPSGGGGAFSAFFSANDGFREPQVRFDSFLNAYVMVYDISDQSAIQMRFSSDGLTWGTATTIVTNTSGTVYYPSLLNTAGGGADPQAIGQNFYVYYIQPFGGSWTSTAIVRTALTVNSSTPAPIISNLSVNIGPVGTAVTITGANFGSTQGASTVTFNDIVATAGTWSAGSIATTVPSGATTGNVFVTVAGQQSNGVNFTVTTPPCSQPWCGIIDPARAIDWTTAGLPGSALPSAGWTQCGSTLPAGTTAAAITTALAGCGGQNKFVLLGVGNFPLSTAITFPTSGHVALRGSGANSTFLIPSTAIVCGINSAAICMKSSDNGAGNGPDRICNWTGGFSQGNTVLTGISDALGTCLSAILTTSSSNPTLLFLDQPETGYTGAVTATPTGSAIDNNALFVCGDHWQSTPTGCSNNGPGNGSSAHRHHFETNVATATGASSITLAYPLAYPDWNATTAPRVWILQSVSQVGVENLAMDATSIQGSQNIGVSRCYSCWISGVKSVNNSEWNFEFFESSNWLVKDSYIYHTTGPDAYGVRLEIGGRGLVQNNIITQAFAPIVFDGDSCCDVVAYNYIINDNYQSDVMRGSMFMHDINGFELFEGNVVNNISAGDGNHGTANMNTGFRNLALGWDSCANGQCGVSVKDSGQSAIANGYGNRYQNWIANVVGTPNLSFTYKSAANSGQFGGTRYGFQFGYSNIFPNDPLVPSTALLWGNYDTATPAVRFCGNSSDTGWATTCASTSEVPTSAAAFPNAVPTKGDTTIGQGALPTSFYLTSKPSWFGSIPFPAIGPDVTSGNVGQCSGTVNTAGHLSGMPALSNAQCTGTSLTASQWAGHVNAIPAMACALNTMGMPPDGTDPGLTIVGPATPSTHALSFDASVCYVGGTAAPNVVLNPTSISFGTVFIGSNFSQPVILSNTGTATLNITSISITGANAADFSQTNNCGSSLTAGNGCTITVKFTPSIASAESASVTIVDNAAGNPHTVPLSGTGSIPIPVANPNPVSASFGNTAPLCLPSSLCPMQTITVTNTGNANLLFAGSGAVTLTPAGGTPGGDFTIAAGTTCTNGLSVGPGSSCKIVVQFGPTIQAVAESATLTLIDNAMNSPQTVPVAGTGFAPAPATAFAEMREDL